MKIVAVRHSLLSRGGDKMLVAHASHLAAQGHEVVIRTNRVDTVFRLHPAIRVEPLTFPGKLGTILSALVEKQDADLVIADIVAMACLLLFRNRRRIVFFAQDYDESYYDTRLQRYFIRLLYLVALRWCRVKTIAVAEPLASIFGNRFGATASVVENGVDLSVFFPDAQPDLLSGKRERKSILLLSRSDPRKGFDLAVAVINALALVAADEFEVWTVGVPAARHFPGLPHRDFGYVNETRMRQIMSSADLMLYPSRHEGFPLMVLEAFACRCPVVTTDAVPFALHGENALVTRINDLEMLTAQTLELLRGADLRDKLAEAGRRFAIEHSLPRSTEEFEVRLKAMAEGRLQPETA